MKVFQTAPPDFVCSLFSRPPSPHNRKNPQTPSCSGFADCGPVRTALWCGPVRTALWCAFILPSSDLVSKQLNSGADRARAFISHPNGTREQTQPFLTGTVRLVAILFRSFFTHKIAGKVLRKCFGTFSPLASSASRRIRRAAKTKFAFSFLIQKPGGEKPACRQAGRKKCKGKILVFLGSL